jgi:hypothetical protein
MNRPAGQSKTDQTRFIETQYKFTGGSEERRERTRDEQHAINGARGSAAGKETTSYVEGGNYPRRIDPHRRRGGAAATSQLGFVTEIRS